MPTPDIYLARDNLIAQRDEARRHLAALDRKLEAYEAVIADIEGQDAPKVTSVAPDLGGMTRREAIKRVLRVAPGIPPRQIVERLHGLGRTNDNTHKVSNELNRMQERGEVERRGKGRWFLITDEAHNLLSEGGSF